MRLQNRFKNRFISREKHIDWFSARDFRAGIWAMLANANYRKNMWIMVRLSIRRRKSDQFQKRYKSGAEEMNGFLSLMVKAGAPIYDINKSELYRTKFKEYDFQNNNLKFSK